MKSKEYLQKAYRLENIINSHQREVDGLRAMADGISAVDITNERVQSSPTSFDRVGDIIAKIIELEDLINSEIYDYVDTQAKIHHLISLVPNSTEQLILRLRYIEFYTWEKIAVDLDYTFQWVHVLHKRALKSFEKIMKKYQKNL